MLHLSQYSRRMKLTLVAGLTFAGLASIVVIPFADKKLLKNEVGYYSVIYDGEQIGSANSREDAEQAIANARLRFSKEYSDIVYIDNNINVVEESNLVSVKMSEKELEDSIYSTLFSSVVDKNKQTAYTIKVGDNAYTLASKDDVIELMQRITAKYDTDKQFSVKLTDNDETLGTHSIEVAKAQVDSVERNIVAAAIDGASVDSSDGKKVEGNGISSISFVESISVEETPSTNASLMSVERAYEEITKEKEAKTSHVVVEGDTLSKIASNYNLKISDLLSMNPGLTETSIIIPGQEITVTVPKSEITVIITKRESYEEDYEAETQYVDDDSAYKGDNKVISEGTTGKHKVTADVTYVNGNKMSVDTVSEQIIEEAKAKVVSVGTIVPPTYIRPVSGGYVSQNYGNYGHTGTDIVVPSGTAVSAAASGVVTRASWYADYGYCVDIRHSDGSETRYAHLSSMVVSVGSTVSQGQLIAYSGNTGNSTGDHLHLELRIGGVLVNPMSYI